MSIDAARQELANHTRNPSRSSRHARLGLVYVVKSSFEGSSAIRGLDTTCMLGATPGEISRDDGVPSNDRESSTA